jgi:hypothetical protein
MTGTTEQYGDEVYVYTPALRFQQTTMNEVENEWKIFPNPASTLMNIELPVQSSQEDIRVTVTDLLGRITYQEKRPWNNTFTIPLSPNISNGIYLLRIEATHKHWQQLFEVQE